VKKLKKLLLLVVLAALAGGAFLFFRDMKAPQLAVTPESGAISANRPLLVKAEDPSGLRSLSVTVVQGGKSAELLAKSYPEGTAAEESVSLGGAGLQEGPLEVRFAATDRSSFRFGKGNTAQQTLTLVYDNKPPQVNVLTPHHNLNQGGAGVVVYTVSEEVAKTGVKVGELFFPGFRQPSGIYVCLFAFPWDMSPADFVPKVLAVDAAGNERLAGIFYHVNARTFPTDRIEVSGQFLENKIVPDFQHFFPEVTDPLALFLKVNRELRAENLKTILDYGRQTVAKPLWEGVFLRQPNAAVPGFFAQRRTYYHEGREIDRQTHLGIDLASTAQAPVPAANAGTVIFADDLGIYGNCVIIDHGLGLQTLYGHLSRIGVEAGATVARGESIGHTGTSGLAGGDHLHFDVLVSGRQVNPLEWWDPSWLKNNVTDKLALAGTAR
jgi:murein DD-endopeptidase MepM/ murein hydrolase activator NlpD